MASNDVTRIAGNIGAMNALYALNTINKELSIHTTRLATGKRINSAADDPAGLSIATKMLSRSEGLKQALDNIGDAKNLLSVAESGLGSLNDILIQMRNKAEAAASDTLGTTERDIVKTQLMAYAKQIDDIVAQTKWNGNTLIDGTYAAESDALRFQTGADSGEFTTLSGLINVDSEALNIIDVAAEDSVTFATSAGGALSAATVATVSGTELTYGEYSVRTTVANGSVSTSADVTVTIYDSNNTLVTSHVLDEMVRADGGSYDFLNGLKVTVGTALENGSYTDSVTYTPEDTQLINATNASGFSDYMNRVETAINTVNEQLSMIGSLTGRLTFKEDQISSSQINVEASYNRIMNADMAEEQVNASKLTILQQTATAMLAQANAAPQFLLSLFQ